MQILQSPRHPGSVCVGGGKAPAVLQCLAFTCIACSTKRQKKKKKKKHSLSTFYRNLGTMFYMYPTYWQNSQICHNQNHDYILNLRALFRSSDSPWARARQFTEARKKSQPSINTGTSNSYNFRGRWGSESWGWKWEPENAFICGLCPNHAPRLKQHYPFRKEAIVLDVQVEKVRERWDRWTPSHYVLSTIHTTLCIVGNTWAIIVFRVVSGRTYNVHLIMKKLQTNPTWGMFN